MSGLPQAYGFEHLSPDGGSVFGGCGTFGRWGLTGESGFLGDRPLGLEQEPLLVQGVCFAWIHWDVNKQPKLPPPLGCLSPSKGALCSLKLPDKPLPLQAFLSAVVFTTVRIVIGTRSLPFTYANAKSLLYSQNRLHFDMIYYSYCIVLALDLFDLPPSLFPRSPCLPPPLQPLPLCKSVFIRELGPSITSFLVMILRRVEWRMGSMYSLFHFPKELDKILLFIP